MFGTIGGPELFLIFVIALIVFGPRKLPEIGRSLGKMLQEFRRASTEFKNTLEDEVETEKRRETDQARSPYAAALPGGSPDSATAEAPVETASQGSLPAEAPPPVEPK